MVQHAFNAPRHSSLQDSISSICRSILPFSFKKKRLTAIEAAEQHLAKQQSENLKWQQESFHQILRLIGLRKEGIVDDAQVSDFRTHILQSLATSPFDHEPSPILRDKLIFLQELFYMKCISEEEYNASKRPLLLGLGEVADLGSRDVALKSENKISNEKSDKCISNSQPAELQNKTNESSQTKRIEGPVSVNVSLQPGRLELANNLTPSNRNAVTISTENPFWNDDLSKNECASKSNLIAEKQSGSGKPRKKPFMAFFQRDTNEVEGSNVTEKDAVLVEDKQSVKSKKWMLDGLVKWKRKDEAKSEPFFNDEPNGQNIKTGTVGSNNEHSQIHHLESHEDENSNPNLLA